MMKTSLRFSLAVSVVVLAAVLGAVSLIVAAGDYWTEFQLRSKALYVVYDKPEWFRTQVNDLYSRLRSMIAANAGERLPQVRLYVSERSKKAMQESLPESTGDWQRAYMIYPDRKMRKIKVRHPGDNPRNWIFAKKSWRVKTTKKNTIDNVRTRSYIVSRSPIMVELYFNSLLAERFGILAAPVRPVELFVNDMNQGVYEEVEQLDENFLRTQGLMPVGLYKGEMRMSETVFGMDIDLGNSPAAWKPLSVNNAMNGDSTADLQYVLNFARKAESDPTVFEEFKRVFPLDHWARWAAFERVTGNQGDAIHNLRLLIDNWRGQALPVLKDSSFVIREDDGRLLAESEGSRFSPLRLYTLSSEFELKKLGYMYRSVTDENGVKKAVNAFTERFGAIEGSVRRDPNFGQHMQNLPGQYLWNFDYAEYFLQHVRSFEQNVDSIHAALSRHPDVSWQGAARGLRLMVNGMLPVADLRLTLASPVAPAQLKVAWDRNGNGRLDDDDVRLPIEVEGKRVTIRAAFMANRIRFRDAATLPNAPVYTSTLAVRPTVFGIVANTDLKLENVDGTQPLTGAQVWIAEGEARGQIPTPWNIPVVQAPVPDLEEWAGRIDVASTRVIDAPVHIRAGTELIMAPGASLIFRNHVVMDGTVERPIRVHRKDGDKPWGLISLLGGGTAGSRLTHVSLQGGSGDRIGLVDYTAMLSIHDTHDVRIEYVSLADNVAYDDTLHIIYSRDITVDGVRIDRANSDAIDIDISKINIRNVKIDSSGNDALDLMASEVLVENAELTRSGDKGVSVGEGTRALIYDSLLKGNSIGVESKDRSHAAIVHSELLNNKVQLNAYWKNWRYGSGGQIAITQSRLRGETNPVTAGKRSVIWLGEIDAAPAVAGDKHVNVLDKLTPDLTRKVDDLLEAWNLPPLSTGSPQGKQP